MYDNDLIVNNHSTSTFPQLSDLKFTFSIITVFLSFKLVFVAVNTIIYRARLRECATPEDRSIRDNFFIGFCNLTQYHLKEEPEDKPVMWEQNNKTGSIQSSELTQIHNPWFHIHHDHLQTVLPTIVSYRIYVDILLNSSLSTHLLPSLTLHLSLACFVFIITFCALRVIYTIAFLVGFKRLSLLCSILSMLCNIFMVLLAFIGMIVFSCIYESYQVNLHQMIYVCSVTSLVVVMHAVYIYYMILSQFMEFTQPLFFIPSDDEQDITLSDMLDSLQSPTSRFCNISRNNLENIFPFFVIAYLWSFNTNLFQHNNNKNNNNNNINNNSTSSVSMWFGSVSFLLFLTFRIFYIFCYARKLYPMRFYAYFIGVIVTVVQALWLIALIALGNDVGNPQWFSVSVIWIYSLLLMFLVASLTLRARKKLECYAAPEDYGRVSSFLTSNRLDVKRYLRTHSNHIEVFLLLFLATVGLFENHFFSDWQRQRDLTQQWALVGALVLLAFTRTAYTYFYINAKQPERSITWIVDILILVIVTWTVFILYLFHNSTNVQYGIQH